MDADGWVHRALMHRPELAAVGIVLGLVGCTGAPAPPSEAAAAAYLGSVVEMVRSGDPGSICSVGVGRCERMLRGADPQRLPTSGPEIVATRVVAPKLQTSEAWSAGGRLLQLCGRDGLGTPYYSEMLVFEDGGHLISVNTPFWLGFTFGDTSTTGEVDPHPPCPT